MNRALGGIEKQIISLAENNNVSVDHVVNHFNYTNDLKLECVKILNQKSIKIDNDVLMSCVSKFHMAEKVLYEISSKINN